MFKPIKISKYIEIHISTLLLIFFAVLFDFTSSLLITYVIVIIHEASHILTALFLKVKLDKIEILPFGVTMRIHSHYIKTPKDEIIIAIAGPLSNIIMCLFSLGLKNHGIISDDLTKFLIMANLGIALINIIPALPLDGGRIMKAALTIRWGYVKSFNFTMIITKISISIIILTGTIIIIYTKFNFSILLIGAFLVANAISEQRGNKMIMMREILYSRQKLVDCGTERAGVIAIMHNQPARRVLKLLNYNKYYIINIIDDNMKIIGSITETQLIEGLIDKGIRVKAISFTQSNPL